MFCAIRIVIEGWVARLDIETPNQRRLLRLPVSEWERINKYTTEPERLMSLALANPHVVVERLSFAPTTPVQSSAISAQPSKRDWLESFASFVPKSIREPWLGDLREDRVRMRRDGRSPRFVFWATAIQLGLLLFHNCKESIRGFFVPKPTAK